MHVKRRIFLAAGAALVAPRIAAAQAARVLPFAPTDVAIACFAAGTAIR